MSKPDTEQDLGHWPGDDWRVDAECRGMHPAAFYRNRDSAYASNAALEPADEAVAVCARCPVRPQCLATATRDDERWGVWGGTTPSQRRRGRRRAITDIAGRDT